MACVVKVNRHGYLAFRLYWNGIKSWEGTGLKDNAKNRQRVEARAVLISEEMERDNFDYLKWFPNGNKVHLFQSSPTVPNIRAQEKTVRQYYEEWIKSKKPPLVRKSRERDYRQAFKKHILPFLGDMLISQITARKLEDFRIHLLEEAKLSLKSARNIIDAY